MNRNGGDGMNIETANRLYEYRKANSLSQEELAERLGISRQSVSKWERAEATPDAENLINLAKLYNVTLDDLINKSPVRDAEPEKETVPDEEDGAKEKIHIGWDGIHIEDGDDTVKIGFGGIHVKDKDTEVRIGKDVTVNGEKYDKKKFKCEMKDAFSPKAEDFPIGAICLIAYLLVGIFMREWGRGLLIFFAVPILHGIIKSIRRRRAKYIPYFSVITAAYLCVGAFYGVWHPTWVMFLSLPVFHWLC